MIRNVILSLYCVAGFALAQNDSSILVQYSNVSIDVILKDYSGISGNRVDIAKGQYNPITIISYKGLTEEEYLDFVEKELNKLNIGLFPIGENRLVAAWIDPEIAPQLRRRVVRLDRKAETQRLHKEHLEALRAGKPPKPIPLTPEMDDYLVKKGILPPRMSPHFHKFKSSEELLAHVRELQMDAIRKGKEPLPIPLSPEMETQLIEEGVLEVGEWERNPEDEPTEKENGS